MAVLPRGMDPEEPTNLALVMAESGDILDLSGVVDLAVGQPS